jgi:hypothetical protein
MGGCFSYLLEHPGMLCSPLGNRNGGKADGIFGSHRDAVIAKTKTHWAPARLNPLPVCDRLISLAMGEKLMVG